MPFRAFTLWVAICAVQAAASGRTSGSTLHIVQASQELPASVYQASATAGQGAGLAQEDSSFANPPRSDVQANLDGATVYLRPYTSAYADNDDLLSFS
mmetsp:Transcript_17502/g.40774  ORF Transcript_17502/g.40774 Transcript_17502/m.40774 type:complete len:98 (+) Transcript_17502:104-397(+)|eukprot:CAMPEP_0178413948 /NCGR_PEP_ID=MMETSP0689_2-20121128/22787_1 /TAXON_ID=160604 /ORGANISM="Amphidinium massartii, Strain CS-259" /LENGTH=97 /DNA_ID=CAMNT_0020035229 /DNA_START=98 /DNA_END=391 /DNA_ORIENTATION=-